MRSRHRARHTPLLLLVLVLPTPVTAAQLDIELTGIESGRGLVRAAVCNRTTFTTKHCPFAAAVPAQAGTVTIRVDGIPAGRYAVQAYHDEDGNGQLRRGLFGIPAEAIGFSRDARVRMSAPAFEDAAIDITEPVTNTRLRLRRLGF